MDRIDRIAQIIIASTSVKAESIEEKREKFVEFLKKFEGFMKNMKYGGVRDMVSFDWQYDSNEVNAVYLRTFFHGEFPTTEEKLKEAADKYPKAYKELQDQKTKIKKFVEDEGYKVYFNK